jgi:hypothetical protein
MTHTRAFAPLIPLALLAAALFLTGCPPKDQTTLESPPPDSNPQPQLAAEVRQRVQQVNDLARQYADNAARLPARSEQEDRAAVAEQFGLLAQILPALNGPDMPGDFRQQHRIIDSTRALLSSSSSDLAPEPTIDSGLRAAHRALASVNARNFAGGASGPEVAKSLDAMRDRVLELDTVAGPIHRLVAAQAIQASAAAITQMSTALQQRLNEQGTGAAAPKAVTPPDASKPQSPKPVEQPKAETARPETVKPAEQPRPDAAKPAETKPAEQPKPAVPELNK